MAIGPTIENLRKKRAEEAALLKMLYALPTPTGGFDVNTPAERRQLAEIGLRGGEPYSDGRMDYGRQRPVQETIDVMPQQPAEFYARQVSRDLFGERATNDLFGYPQGTGNLVGDILAGGGMLGAIGATAPLTAWDAGAAAARGDYGDAALKSAFSLLEGAQLGELATGARGLRAVANEFPEAAQKVGQRVRGFLADESGSVPLPFKADDPAQAGGFLSDGNGSASIPLSTAEGSRRVSTRFPTGARSTEDPMTSQLSMNFNEALAGDVGAHNARLLSRYPGFARLSGMTPEEAARAYVDQSAGNLRYLIDRMPRGAIEETSQWYEGANRISDSLASRVGVPRQSMSANLAALSPQKDWFQNASLGERVADIVASQYDAPPTGEMMAYIFTNPKINTPRYTDELANMQGKAFRDMSDLQKAVYVRAFDELYNPRNYRSVTPEGFLGDYVMTATGNPAKIAWGSFNEIGKAVRALESGGDMSIISPLLGERHKVRSFYNNIEDPYETFGEFGDVTGDTHAVAANQLRPLSGNTTAVAQNFGNSLDRKYQGPDWEPAKGSAVSGVQGTYGFNTEPYRQIAADYNVRPRGAQSVGWEAVRALFPDTFKTERNVNKIDDIWRAYDAGKISLDDARAAVFDAAQGFTGGNWGQPRSGLTRPEQGSTFR